MKTVVDRGKDRKDGRDLEKQETGIQRRKRNTEGLGFKVRERDRETERKGKIVQ